MMVWLSFSDGDRSDGFLGVVIIEVPDTEFTVAALRKALGEATRLGLNPGGEVRGYEINRNDEESYRPWIEQVLPREIVQELGEKAT